MSTRTPIIGGNWKSNGTRSSIGALIKVFNEIPFDPTKVDFVICPTTLHCEMCQTGFKKEIQVGTQNVSKTGAGAFTGEWTAEMVADMGMKWTIIGHSERRHKYGETDADTAVKVEAALKAGLNVILAIGELLDERKAGQTNEVCARQLLACFPVISDWSRVVIAYEPVWAIGTGVVASPEEAQEAHAAVRKLIAEKVSAEVAAAVRIQYGGSVSPSNCKDLIALPDVDGFLVGGAALKPDFGTVVVACQN